MSEPPREPVSSDFRAAAATLRETVKWLAAAFAGAAGLVIGTSPLAGLGRLEHQSGLWVTAILLLLLGFLLICLALWRTLRILRPDVLYRSDLLAQDEDRELKPLRQEIDAHAADLLPHNYASLAALAQALDEVKRRLEEAKSHADPAERARLIAKGQGLRAQLLAGVDKRLPLAQYLRLQQRFEREQPWMAAFGILALLALLGFGMVTGVPEKKEAPPAPVIHVDACPGSCPGTPPITLPALSPVLFDSGSANLSAAGQAAIQLARDALNRHPRTLLLVQAHTDTMAPRSYNEGLAQRRAQAVLQRLCAQGGIAPERVVVSYLPETALPAVTADQAREAVNRSVRLSLIEDTRR